MKEPSMKTWARKLSGQISRLAIPNLMRYIVIGMGAAFILDAFLNGLATRYLAFDKAAIQAGQVWRVVSFIFIPIVNDWLFIIFVLYFYWMIGDALETEWGSAKFNLFYLTGIIGTIAAGLITGYATNHFLNLSLFFAFAILFPDFEIRLFFIIPVKVKWLAILDAAYFAYALAISSWPARIALLVALANIAIFFWRGMLGKIVQIKRRQRWRRNFR
jgi:hypothetical protein